MQLYTSLFFLGHSEIVGSVTPLTSFFQPNQIPTSDTLHFLTEEQLLNSTHLTSSDECQTTGGRLDSEPFRSNEPMDGLQFQFDIERKSWI